MLSAGLNTSTIIFTKSSKIRGQTDDFKVVTFNAYKKKIKNKKVSDESKSERECSGIDMKKTRFEIYKFSKSDLNFSNRQKSNVELAIQLGAKPKKNAGKNYKLLKSERLIKEHEKEKDSLCKQMTNNYKNKMATMKKNTLNKPSFKNKSKQSGILGSYGKVSQLELKQAPITVTLSSGILDFFVCN